MQHTYELWYMQNSLARLITAHLAVINAIAFITRHTIFIIIT